MSGASADVDANMGSLTGERLGNDANTIRKCGLICRAINTLKNLRVGLTYLRGSGISPKGKSPCVLMTGLFEN